MMCCARPNSVHHLFQRWAVEHGDGLQRADMCAVLVSLRPGQQLGTLIARSGEAQLGGGPGGGAGRPAGGRGCPDWSAAAGGGQLGLRGAGLAGEGGARVAQHTHGLAHE
jgi:hypothetical protein